MEWLRIQLASSSKDNKINIFVLPNDLEVAHIYLYFNHSIALCVWHKSIHTYSHKLELQKRDI